jgi:hypothetical protein
LPVPMYMSMCTFMFMLMPMLVCMTVLLGVVGADGPPDGHHCCSTVHVPHHACDRATIALEQTHLCWDMCAAAAPGACVMMQPSS